MSLVRCVAYAVAAASFGSTTACNLLFSVDGYAGPADGSVTRETGTPVEAAGPPGEAAAPPVDAGSFCPDGAILCDDFARTTLTGGPWDTIDTEGGSLTIVGGPALDAIVEAGLSTQGVFLSKVTDASVQSSVTYSFGLNILEGLGVQPAHLVFVAADMTVSSLILYLRPQPGTGVPSLVIASVVCNPTCQGFNETSPDVVIQNPNEWHTVSWTVDFASASVAYTLTVDGQTITPTFATGAAQPEPGQLTVQCGATYVDTPHPDINLLIDRVIVTGQ